MEFEYEYGLFVIGGGSGGLACARTAASLGVKVGLADFVKPSTAGSKWGLGGTCVNVGCIPKKLMHYTGLLGESLHDLRGSGWEIPGEVKHSWEKMVEGVQNHIKRLNYGYRTGLKKEKVVYLNKLARLIDEHTIELTDITNQKSKVTAKYIVIAVGGRPNIPENLVPYQANLISSDDIFSKKVPPGKTLVVGASYIALECAGFLTALGFNTTIMVRSILLRGFDQDMAEKIRANMLNSGTNFIEKSVPIAVELTPEGKKKVSYESEDKTIKSEEFDTVMLAVGRAPDVKGLGLELVGLAQDKSTKKIIVNEADCTNVSNIFCIGDVAFTRPELTPSAIMAGRLLARRLFAGSKILMDYNDIPTTVFTPLEYACVGLSEDKAIEVLGKENIDVYHTNFKPLEWNLFDHVDSCYVKMIVTKQDQKVKGIHYLGPNAGEVIQGYAVAVKMGATKKDFERTVGIHPTCAEEVVDLKETKEKNPAAAKEGC